MSEIDGDLLISLIQMKPILWDKEWGTRKDRKGMKQAWYEVCAGLRDDFEDIQEREQNSFIKDVIRRWTNIRDTFAKSIKKRSIRNVFKKHRKYIYHDQLHFLHKYYEFENKVGNAKHDTKNTGTPIKKTDAIYMKTNDISLSSTTRSSEKKSDKTISSKEVTMENSDWHLSFFNSVLPNIEKFDEHEILMFQMGVLQLIFDIKEQRKTKTNSSSLFPSSSSRQLASMQSNFRTTSEESKPMRSLSIEQQTLPQSLIEEDSLLRDASIEKYKTKSSSLASSPVPSLCSS